MAEILNFQCALHLKGMGSLSYINHKYTLTRGGIQELQHGMKLDIIYEGESGNWSNVAYIIFSE